MTRVRCPRLWPTSRARPGAASIVDPLGQPAEAGLISPDGRTAMIPVGLDAAEDAELPDSAGALIDHVDEIAVPDGVTVAVTGEWPVWSDFNKTNEEALHKAELLSAIPTMILLLIAFGSAIAAGLPLMLALAGIAVGFASLHLIGGQMPLSVWSMNFSMMIGLAVGIDYSLFIVSRYREEREDGNDADGRHRQHVVHRRQGRLPLGPGRGAVLAAVFVVPVMVFRSMALGMILSVVAVALASLTLLPAVLVALGDKVLVAKDQEDPDRPAEGRWARWTGLALCHPGRTLTAGLVLLLLIAAPAIGMRLGMPGARVVDEGRSSRDGYEMLADAFGPGAVGPLFVTVPATEAQEVVVLATADPNVVDARVVAEPAASGRTVVRITPADRRRRLGHHRHGRPTPHQHRRRRPRRIGRRTRRTELRPDRGPDRSCAHRHRPHHDRGVPDAADRVPEPHHRRVVHPA